MFFIKKFYFTQKWLEHMHISTKSKKKKTSKSKISFTKVAPNVPSSCSNLFFFHIDEMSKIKPLQLKHMYFWQFFGKEAKLWFLGYCGLILDISSK